jgi:hypothetical protein
MILAISVILTACNAGETVSGIDDLIDQIPGMSIIDGADNTTIVVNKNQSESFYHVTLNDLKPEASSLAGEYNAWCSQWDIAIGSNNSVYGGVKIFNIAQEGYWKNVVYLVNSSVDYLAADENLTWAELQIAVWAMINHKKIDLDQDFIDNLGNEFSSVSLDKVNLLLSDVSTKITNYDFSQLDYEVYYAEINPEVQDLILTRAID